MNRNRQRLTSQQQKKKIKAIRQANKEWNQQEEIERTDTLTPKKALKTLPAKKSRAKEALIKKTVKNMAIHKKQQEHKHSKRTAPGDIDHRESLPQHAHSESDHWEETRRLQNKMQNKTLTQKLQRRQSKKKR